jgi:hypothetical protein
VYTDTEMEQPKQKPEYWFDGVCIHDGWAWATEIVEVEPVDGRRRWDTFPLCLGKDTEILPILKGDAPIPEDMHRRRRAVLELILGDNGNGRNEAAARAPRLQRGRLVKSPRRIERGFRHA